MFRNYLLTAWKVLLRRKVFTFISLFGIAITLTVLMVASTIIDSYLYPTGPQKNSDNFLSISRLTLKAKNSVNNSNPGFKFLTTNVSRLKSPELISFFTQPQSVATFLSGIKLNNSLRRTDSNYWKILNFEFIEGNYYSKEDVQAGKNVMVISQTTAREFFGPGKVVGKNLVASNQTFSIVGVVKDVSQMEQSAASDMWVPYTTAPSTQYQHEMMSGWEVLLYHSNPQMLVEMKSEYAHLLKNDFVTPDPERYKTAHSGADTPLERLARKFTGSWGDDSNLSGIIYLFIFGGLGFMLLPSVNLINLNISRIMERSSEIGVRKAFGASGSQLVVQFVVENILITAIGGIIGLFLSWFVLYQIGATDFIANADFSLNWRTFLVSTILILILGIISGVYPAYKMSRIHPVIALKGAL